MGVCLGEADEKSLIALPPVLTRANRLVTCFEAVEDGAGGVGEVGVEGNTLNLVVACLG